jgi:hypothetical protein
MASLIDPSLVPEGKHALRAYVAGIRVPTTAASGAVTANTLVSGGKHFEMLNKIRIPEK